ncbi:MAG: lytic transglycosylase domain-containing protein [Paracoccaceae bacterium]
MTPRKILVTLLPIILAANGLASARAMPDSDAARMCLDAARYAAQETGVPYRVLVALTLTETGRSRDGALQPWAWSLNEGGASAWFSTREEALEHLTGAIAGGVRNIDVGCFQLNYRWHGAAFASLDAMMEPRSNALYAARLLGRLAGDSGDWIAAAGAYHSATPEVADRYLSRFTPILTALADTGQDTADAGPLGPETRANAFPLLQAGGSRSAGSIVPIATGGRRLIGAP